MRIAKKKKEVFNQSRAGEKAGEKKTIVSSEAVSVKKPTVFSKSGPKTKSGKSLKKFGPGLAWIKALFPKLLIAVLVILTGFFFFQSLNLTKKISLLKKEAWEREKREELSRQLQKEINDYKEAIGIARQVFPKEEKFIQLVKTTEKMGAEEKVKVDFDFKSLEPNFEGELGYLDANIIFTGETERIFHLFKRGLPFVFETKEIEGVIKKGGLGETEMILGARIYVDKNFF